MANISQTAASVGIGSVATPTRKVAAGEAITQGMPVYKATDGKYYQCDANDSATAIKARCGGIAITPAGAADASFVIAEPGNEPGQSLVNLGATLVVGGVYAVSATKGAIAPIADITTGDFVTTIGIATTAALLDFQVAVSNTQRA